MHLVEVIKFINQIECEKWVFWASKSKQEIREKKTFIFRTSLSQWQQKGSILFACLCLACMREMLPHCWWSREPM